MSVLSPGGTDKVLCHDQTHVYLTGENLCTCGLNWYDWQEDVSLTKHSPLSGGVIPGYTPNSFAPQRPPTPPTAGQGADVNIAQFKAAQSTLEATHLSADGQRVYIQMSDGIRVCFWDEETKRFGSSFPCDGLPADAVKM